MSEPTRKRVIGKHACESCRKSKIRCLTDTFEEHSKCRKCFASGLECNWKPIPKTRITRRTDARVAELERQVRAMSGNLHSVDANHNTINAGSPYVNSSDALSSTLPEAEPRTNGNISQLPEHSSASPLSASILLSQSSSDHVCRRSLERHDHGISKTVHNEMSDAADHPTSKFTSARKEELLSIFTTALLPQCPIVGVPPGVALADIEKTRPFTVAAMITASCVIAEPEQFNTLHQANIRLLADQVVLGNKSLDLVQAFLISATWTDPPDDLSRMNIYQWAHIASTMANELDIAGRLSKQAPNYHLTQLDPVNLSEKSLELLRVIWGVYLTCSRVSISCHKQNMAVFQPWMPPLLGRFAHHAAGIYDRRLAAWMHLQLIAEDMENMKRRIRTQPQGSYKMKNDLASFHDRLESWEKSLSQTTLNDTMKMDLWFYWSKLHCFPNYFDEDTRHLELSSLATNGGGSSPTRRVSLNPASIRGLLSYIRDCHSILDVFLGIDYESIRCLSSLALLRVPYAFKAISILEKRASNPHDGISRIIDQETVHWPYYAKNISQAMEGASHGGLYPAPTLVLRIRNRAANRVRLRDIMNKVASDEKITPQNSTSPSTSGAPINPDAETQTDFAFDTFDPGWMDLDFPREFAFDDHWGSELLAANSQVMVNTQY